MSTPMQLPMRILVKGPSTVLWTSMMGGPRTHMAFPRVLEQRLLAGGRACEVRNAGYLGWPTRDLFTTWDDEIVAWSPDVIILALGHYEVLHTILPRWLERGANTVNRRSGWWRHILYKRILRGLARVVLILQKKIDRPGRRLRRRRLQRVFADTRAYIEMTRQVGHPLILLMEIHPPSGIKRDWYGGWTERTHELNTGLRAIAETYAESNVRFVEITDLMARFEGETPETLWADGIHFSPDFHHAIGQKFADVTEQWARTQPHLAEP